ncbi:MAG TPA: S1 RNA-binding domain-containing protein [Planctomycetota bacterium]|jgi:ribosomal protein S1|nr:S1 RNA-binding domain-containing protein [Planctomycetota bacterium]
MTRAGDFPDAFDDLWKEASQMSEADVERLLLGGGTSGQPSSRSTALAPGARVEGMVIEVRRGEVLVELDGKTLGVLSESEFDGVDLPRVGDRIRAQFERFDARKDVAVLSAGGVRREIYWEELRRGTIVEGTVTAVNKGGLTVDLKGNRAFLPASQVARQRVEDLAQFVGTKIRCEITDVDLSSRNIVLSRRTILEREQEAEQKNALARLSEGEVLRGTVTRQSDFGAFVDLGGVDGLIPANKIHALVQSKAIPAAPKEGQVVEVIVTRVDKEKGRVGLELRQVASDRWKEAAEHYGVGDEVTGWVTRASSTEVALEIGDGLEAVFPESQVALLGSDARPGAILKAVVTAIDRDTRRILLKPAPGRPPR